MDDFDWEGHWDHAEDADQWERNRLAEDLWLEQADESAGETTPGEALTDAGDVMGSGRPAGDGERLAEWEDEP